MHDDVIPPPVLHCMSSIQYSVYYIVLCVAGTRLSTTAPVNRASDVRNDEY